MWHYKGRTGIHPEGEYGKQLPIRYFAALNCLFQVELCLGGSSFPATALQTSMRLSARRLSDHMKLLRQVSVLQRRSGRDKRETEYVIQRGRKAEDGTAIFDFSSGQLHFPLVRLRE